MTTDTSVPLIAHVLFRFDIGGLENGVVNLINRMPAARYRHAIVCLKDYSPEFFARVRREDVEIFALDKQPGHDLGLLRRLYATFRTLRPTIVHSRNFSGLDAQLPALLAGVPCRVHGEHGWDHLDLGGVNRKHQLYRWAHRPLIDLFVPLSRQIEAYLHEQIGVPARRLRRICNGVDVARFQPREAAAGDARLDGRARAGDVVVGTVGRLQPVKDQVTLVRAFAAVTRARPALRERLHLVLLGEGPSRTDIEQAVAAEGIADRTWLAGARDDVPRLMREFDVFVLPSLAEGISNTILEALASGLPVIATAVGGNPELVAEGDNGALVPPGDVAALAAALEPLVSDDALRRARAARARATALAEFSLETMVGNYLAMYDEVMQRKGVARVD
ncbi:MAG: TIGR03088 family PEP-CTERM/XrtA system glycosyltransferase [Gammaproteobacteria bacterium]|nr:TIGR03088 family PEP-CTERM/XrtA system glycosyltransferase [Gammaproteobacteria bacterium]